MLLAKMTALAAVLALGACAAIDTHVATSQPQNAITPEIPNLKPFPPEEPPAVITASPDYGSANLAASLRGPAVTVIQLQRQAYRCKCGFEITGLAGRQRAGVWRKLRHL